MSDQPRRTLPDYEVTDPQSHVKFGELVITALLLAYFVLIIQSTYNAKRKTVSRPEIVRMQIP